MFLNLDKDEYTMLEGGQAAAFVESFSATVRSTPRPVAANDERCSIGTGLTELVDDGLLTTDQSRSKDVLPTEMELPCKQLLYPDDRPRVPIKGRDVWRFVTSCARAAIGLRTRHISATVNAVRRRKTQRAPSSQFDVERARTCVATFNALRSLFPGRYLCLFDSLALLEFLARYKLYPTWVFAVRFEPWAAHCWVQEGDLALNEDVEETEDYVPVMTV